MKSRFVFVIIIVLTTNLFAQESKSIREKGDFYFYWGYNRALYSNSDIKFTGGYNDFELENVKAVDKPTEFSFQNYFKPANISIPQYVYRIGYFINSNWSISLGMDHMKYVMTQDQVVTINGEIGEPESPYRGVYDNGQVKLTSDFLEFEHTDGLNYLNAGADFYYDVYTSVDSKFNAAFVGGAGIGMFIPKSNVLLLDGERNDVFHIAGYGFHGNLGGQLTFWKHLFLRTQIKGGFCHMPDVLVRPGDVNDRASQYFWFGMWDMVLGYQWNF